MRYEAMVITDAAKARTDVEAMSKSMVDLVTKCGGTAVEIEKYGERKLAFNIGKHRRGYYYLIHFDMPGNQVPQLNRELRLNEDAFRSVVQLDADAGFERRDLANPRSFNSDSGDIRSRFERPDGTGGRSRGDRDSYDSPFDEDGLMDAGA